MNGQPTKATTIVVLAAIHMLRELGLEINHNLVGERTRRRLPTLQSPVSAVVGQTELGYLNGVGITLRVPLPRYWDVWISQKGRRKCGKEVAERD